MSGQAQAWEWISPPSSSFGVSSASSFTREVFEKLISNYREPVIVFAVNPDVIATKPVVGAKLCLSKRKKTLAYWSWELKDFPPAFVSLGNLFDCILVPSEFVRESLVSSGISEEVVKVAPPIDCFRIPQPSLESRGYFLHIADSKSDLNRKGTSRLLKTYQVLSENGEAKFPLIVKLDNSRKSRRLRLQFSKCTDIVFVLGELNDVELENLFRGAMTYVSPHSSEGFGLSLWRSKVEGIPSIATCYAGNADFFCEECDIPIDYEMESVQSYASLTVNSHWARIDESSLLNGLKKVTTDLASGTRRERCRHISVEYHQEITIQAFKAAIGDQKTNNKRNAIRVISAISSVLLYLLVSRARLILAKRNQK